NSHRLHDIVMCSISVMHSSLGHAPPDGEMSAYIFKVLSLGFHYAVFVVGVRLGCVCVCVCVCVCGWCSLGRETGNAGRCRLMPIMKSDRQRNQVAGHLTVGL